ncbi:MAG: hypothetical protein MJ229_04870 [bacterium]|nr:hypothetical protein [bacterium]
MNIVAIIPAFGKSKNIPRKNLKTFLGKPILSYAIDACISSNIFEEVTVATDSDEITELAEGNGASVPFKMDNCDVSTDEKLAEILIKALNKYKEQGKEFEYVCCVLPCVPFLKKETLRNALDLLEISKSNSLIPITKYSYDISKAFQINNSNEFDYCNKDMKTDSFYRDAELFYIIKTETLLETKKLTTDACEHIEVEESETCLLNTEEQWEKAEIYSKVLKELKEKKILSENSSDNSIEMISKIATEDASEFSEDEEDYYNQYVDKSALELLLASNISIWSKIINNTRDVKSCLEFGCNIGNDIIAINKLLPKCEISGIESNIKVAEILNQYEFVKDVYNQSILQYKVDYKRDLTIIKGILRRIAPYKLEKLYEKLYDASNKYILIADYYYPIKSNFDKTNTEQNTNDYAGEMLKKYPDLRLVDYGFYYHGDNNFNQNGDMTWFLLEKTEQAEEKENTEN